MGQRPPKELYHTHRFTTVCARVQMRACICSWLKRACSHGLHNLEHGTFRLVARDFTILNAYGNIWFACN